MPIMAHETHNDSNSAYARIMRAIAVVVLVSGLIAAAAVFVLAPDAPDESANPYVASVDTSKKYQLELQRIGGKAAVASAELGEWFDSLWQGRRLAATIAALSIGVSLLCFLAAKLPPLDD